MRALPTSTSLILRCNADAVGIASKGREGAGTTALRASRLRFAEHLSMREMGSAPGNLLPLPNGGGHA
jgi:hypothetical protein